MCTCLYEEYIRWLGPYLNKSSQDTQNLKVCVSACDSVARLQ